MDGETRIIWHSGKFGKSDTIYLTLVVSERENQEIEVGITSYSKNKEKGTVYVQDIMNYFRMNFKVRERGV